MDEFLSKLYFSPKTGYISARKLYEKAKELDGTIRLKQVKDWYDKQLDIQRFKPQKKRFDDFKITSRNPNVWQADLAFWHKKPILTAININSRIGYAKMLQSKAQKNIMSALDHFTKKFKVSEITTDNGSEFMNNKVQSFFKTNNIEHFNNEAGEHNTLGKIERFNRTLKQRLVRFTDARLSQKVLDNVVHNYNNTYHTAIKATPNKMRGEVIESELEHNRDVMNSIEDELIEGDSVVYRLKKGTFSKEGAIWSKNVYKVVGIDGYKIQIQSKNNHVLYKSPNDLKIVQSAPTEAEFEKNQIYEVESILSHKKLKNGKYKYLVSWVGSDELTWEPQDHLRLINKNKRSKLEEDYFKKTINK